MTDLLQPHILLKDNAHDLPQHYLHTYFIHPNLCHWPPRSLTLSPYATFLQLITSILFSFVQQTFLFAVVHHALFTLLRLGNTS